MATDEVWRLIGEAPAYRVSSLGRVMSKRFGRPLSPGYCRGYARHTLCVDGRKIIRSVHALVCSAFNGPKPSPELHCAHRDGDKSNNTPENLYWATPKENCDDRERHGRTHRGPRTAGALAALPRGREHWAHTQPERVRRGKSHWRTGTKGRGAIGALNGVSKLTEADVIQILAEPKIHGSGRKLAEKYGVSMGLITSIRKGRVWAYVPR